MQHEAVRQMNGAGVMTSSCMPFTAETLRDRCRHHGLYLQSAFCMGAAKVGSAYAAVVLHRHAFLNIASGGVGFLQGDSAVMHTCTKRVSRIVSCALLAPCWSLKSHNKVLTYSMEVRCGVMLLHRSARQDRRPAAESRRQAGQKPLATMLSTS